MTSRIGRFLHRRWFLIALALGCLLAAISPSALAWTRHTPPRWIMPITLLLAALTMESRRLLASLRSPWAAVWAVALGYSVPPILGWGFSTILSEDYRFGLLICSAAPCTLASAAIWTRLAGGDDAVALLATLISTSVSWLATTSWLALTTGHHVAIGYGAIMRDLALILLLPVGIGQAIRAAPSVARFAVSRQSLFSVCARLLVLLMLFRALHDLSRQYHQFPESILGAPLLPVLGSCLSTHLLALLAGYRSSAWLGFGRPARIAVSFAASQKTLPVSLVLLDLIFPNRPLAVVPLLVYHAGQLTVDTIIAERWMEAKHATPAEAAVEPQLSHGGK